MQAALPGLKYPDITGKIIGIFYDVYNELGCGFLESLYEESLVVAFREEAHCESTGALTGLVS